MQIESAQHVVFYIIAALAIIGALGVVFAQDVVHASLMLILTLMLTAGVYVLLSAEFLALVQVLVYGGGVSILVIFAYMVARIRDARSPLDGAQKPFAVVAGIAVAAVLTLMVLSTEWPGGRAPTEIIEVSTSDPTRTVIGTRAIGEELFTTFALPFELASLVLLAALVGAIVLARTEEEEPA